MNSSKPKQPITQSEKSEEREGKAKVLANDEEIQRDTRAAQLCGWSGKRVCYLTKIYFQFLLISVQRDWLYHSFRYW